MDQLQSGGSITGSTGSWKSIESSVLGSTKSWESNGAVPGRPVAMKSSESVPDPAGSWE